MIRDLYDTGLLPVKNVTYGRGMSVEFIVDERPVEKFKPVRIGVMRNDKFRRIATIGLSGDGGIWISPALPGDGQWVYGRQSLDPARPGVLETLDPVKTDKRVKLHYHRSGFVSPSLTGVELDRRSVKFPGLIERSETQIFSMVASRTWEFREETPKAGDALWIVDKWPDWFQASFAVYLFGGSDRARTVGSPLVRAAGLLEGDGERFVINLAGHGISGVLAIRMGSLGSDEGPVEMGLEPSVSVTALPRASSVFPGESFSLWSANLTGPISVIEGREEFVGIDHFVGDPRLFSSP